MFAGDYIDVQNRAGSGGVGFCEKITFFYYTDGAICDENDEPVEDIAGSIGEDAKDHFGEYEDDAVYIRNDRLKIYYELLMSLKSYSEDVLPNKPFLHPSGDVLD